MAIQAEIACPIHLAHASGAEERDTLFITMELLSGETLADRILRGPMAVSQVIPLAVEALTALQVIHEQGLVHRDLKPANIFLTPHGVKILDFGLARPASSMADPTLTMTATRLTQAGTMMGTPRYMAPEQVLGDTVSVGKLDLKRMDWLAAHPVAASARPPQRTGPRD